MELYNIEKLIEKYENAETTLQEEEALRAYFQNEQIPAHLLGYKAMFSYFDESKAERYTKTIPLKTQKLNWKWLSVAAAAVIMISIYVHRSSEQHKAQLAYQETQQALQLVSQKLNKGGSVAIAGLNEYEKTQNKVFKGLDNQ